MGGKWLTLGLREAAAKRTERGLEANIIFEGEARGMQKCWMTRRLPDHHGLRGESDRMEGWRPSD